ncbi:MAG: phosphoribulokinase [Thermoleophilaceae bacterium]|nr:phosphoribulokinase [Thermoleophilaceae bacterium]
MPRPVILGVVGDSATGKTTITDGLVRVLGEDNVAHIGTDDYHKYDREQRKELGITPLNPECNYVDIMAQHLELLSDGKPLLKPIYVHSNGTFDAPEYVEPRPFAIVEGLLGYYTEELREAHDVRVFLAPPEDLRRKWKIDRDSSKRGYTEEEVLADLEKREPDSEQFIRPQRRYADLIVTFRPTDDDADVVDAELTLKEGLPHPDLSPLVEGGRDDIQVEQRDGESTLRISGAIDMERAREIEEAVWERMHFAKHLRTEDLGVIETGGGEQRSQSLAILQVLLLYQLVTARATVALGGDDARTEGDEVATSSSS